MVDRYTKVVLTVIASALLYLCAVLTPLPAASAQAKRPGDSTGPAEAVIVGWRTDDRVPVSVAGPVTITATTPLPVAGSVTTERSGGLADRVVLVGWEENAIRNKPAPSMKVINSLTSPGFPVVVQPPK